MRFKDHHLKACICLWQTTNNKHQNRYHCLLLLQASGKLEKMCILVVMHSVWCIQCDEFNVMYSACTVWCFQCDALSVMHRVWCIQCDAFSVMHSVWCIQCDAFSAVHSVCRERRLPITHGAVLDEVTLIELKQSTHDWNILLPHGRCNLAELCRKVTQAFRTVSMNNRQLTVEFKYNTLGFELECAAASWFCSVL